ncbi:hypothetical protein SISNIDRAFT_451788 [Sistotremastrum niveocremeum HHB9708]|uniref:Uncharacterized protein n=1 Tax=Sistotremastrum niveocremeum HHB9708 TaxID=1314777 RepID=A0A164XLZ2_9AGAM|nr:hypothetical protein SISNIDRAFT_451788 [Sistotremastrum niveocremeum HHB9708]
MLTSLGDLKVPTLSVMVGLLACVWTVSLRWEKRKLTISSAIWVSFFGGTIAYKTLRESTVSRSFALSQATVLYSATILQHLATQDFPNLLPLLDHPFRSPFSAMGLHPSQHSGILATPACG